MSQGGGEDDLSKVKMVSSAIFVYLKSVSALSYRSKDCRRYRHPRSAGVPVHDVTLSVKSQSVVSSCLFGLTVSTTRIGAIDPHMTESGSRESRRHWPVKCANKSVISTSRLQAVAMAILKRLEWINLKTIKDGGKKKSGILASVSKS